MYSVRMPGRRSSGGDASLILDDFPAAALDRLEAFARGLERRLERLEDALGLARVVRRVVADVDVERHESRFGPRMDREVRFGEQHRAGDALRLELKEAIADDREPRVVDGTPTKVAQCVGLRQQWFVGRASVPLSQQMDSVHGV